MIKYLVTEREASLKQEYGDNIPRNLEVAPVGPVHDPAFRGTVTYWKTKDKLRIGSVAIVNLYFNLRFKNFVR